MLDDFYHEGLGSALMGNDWLATVMGRYLKPWERKELAAGWRDGWSQLAEAEREMLAMQECDGIEMVGVVGDEIPF